MIEKNVKMTQTSKSQKFKSKHQLKKCKVNFQKVLVVETLGRQGKKYPFEKKHCSNLNNAKTKQKGTPAFGKPTGMIFPRKHILLIPKKRN